MKDYSYYSEYIPTLVSVKRPNHFYAIAQFLLQLLLVNSVDRQHSSTIRRMVAVTRLGTSIERG